MKLTLTVKMDNAAFADFDDETPRILRDVADKIQNGHTTGPILDANGNRVGSFLIK